jgi:thiamine monophosphate kinase
VRPGNATQALAALAGEVPVTRIGHIERGSGVRVEDESGREIDLAVRGYEHF